MQLRIRIIVYVIKFDLKEDIMRKNIIFILILLLLFNLSGPILADSLAGNEYNYLDDQSWQEILQREDIVEYPVIFVHGLGRRTDVWEDAIRKIVDDDFFEMKYMESNKIFHNYHGEYKNNTIWNVSYYTTNPFEEAFSGDLSLYAKRLDEMISIIKRMTGHDRVVIIGHSMGGLVARKYMVMEEENWDFVHRILTVGTPNLGVETSVEVLGQLKDLKKGSAFLTNLNQSWDEMRDDNDQRWGVIGGVDKKMFFNQLGDANATDSGGPGFVRISSAIPYGEWESATENHFEEASYNTDNFAFRMAINSNHVGLLEARGTFKGIHWVITE